MNVLNGGGGGNVRPKDAVRFLPSLPLSLLPAASDIRVSKNYIPNALLSAYIGDPLQVHTQCPNEISNVGSGELRLCGRGLPVWSCYPCISCRSSCLLAPARFSLSAQHPRLEASTTDSTTWIAATSSYYTWNMTIFLRGDGVSSKYSESLALLRKDLLVIEPWETQLLEGCLWVCVDVCTCVPMGECFSGFLTWFRLQWSLCKEWVSV